MPKKRKDEKRKKKFEQIKWVGQPEPNRWDEGPNLDELEWLMEEVLHAEDEDDVPDQRRWGL